MPKNMKNNELIDKKHNYEHSDDEHNDREHEYNISSNNASRDNENIGDVKSLKATASNILRDEIFKAVFRKKTSKKLLERLIKRLVSLEVEIEQILNSEIVRENEFGKTILLDLVFLTKNNEIITLEIQNKEIEDMEERIKFYTDRLSTITLKRGENYRDIKKIISISLLNHKFYKNEKEIYKHNYKIINKRNSKVFSNDLLDIHIFEKANKTLYDINNLLDAFLMYLYGLLNKQELKNLIKKDKFIKDVEEERLMFSESEREEILKISIEKAERDQRSILTTAKRKAEEKGREEGMEKGREEGREETMFDFAKKLKSTGETLQRISELTGVPIEKIKNI
ncbi:MAG: Rpn family recombination-promoting nuclease/putative transposase [Methanobrevibacter sp.]|jgi:predicted transposase/invertase (TIGR01784 family)|nr:Rpn family recombination-promoting nuclease/putative transposase [Candidatus Methanovirga australis]